MKMPSSSLLAAAVGILTVMTSSSSSQVEAFNVQHATQTPKGLPTNRAAATSATFLEMVNPDEQPDPTTFREAEILGLRLMQEGNFAEALVGTCLLVCLFVCLFVLGRIEVCIDTCRHPPESLCFLLPALPSSFAVAFSSGSAISW